MGRLEDIGDKNLHIVSGGISLCVLSSLEKQLERFHDAKSKAFPQDTCRSFIKSHILKPFYISTLCFSHPSCPMWEFVCKNSFTRRFQNSKQIMRTSYWDRHAVETGVQINLDTGLQTEKG